MPQNEARKCLWFLGQSTFVSKRPALKYRIIRLLGNNRKLSAMLFEFALARGLATTDSTHGLQVPTEFAAGASLMTPSALRIYEKLKSGMSQYQGKV